MTGRLSVDSWRPHYKLPIVCRFGAFRCYAMMTLHLSFFSFSYDHFARYRWMQSAWSCGQMRGERRVLQPAGPLRVPMQSRFPRRWTYPMHRYIKILLFLNWTHASIDRDRLKIKNSDRLLQILTNAKTPRHADIRPCARIQPATSPAPARLDTEAIPTTEYVTSF